MGMNDHGSASTRVFIDIATSVSRLRTALAEAKDAGLSSRQILLLEDCMERQRAILERM